MFGLKTMKIKEQAREIEIQADKIRVLWKDNARLMFHVEQLNDIIQEHVLSAEAFESNYDHEL